MIKPSVQIDRVAYSATGDGGASRCTRRCLVQDHKRVVALTAIFSRSRIAADHPVGFNKSSEGDLLNRIMASKTLTAVPRGFLFCASHKPIEALDDSDEEDHLFAERHSRRQEFLLGQIKNNLASKVMISHRYHMEPVTVGYDTGAQKDIKASKLTIHGLITQDVEDIVLEQEKARKGVRTQGTKAAAWLVGHLKGKGEVPSSQIKEDARRPTCQTTQ